MVYQAPAIQRWGLPKISTGGTDVLVVASTCCGGTALETKEFRPLQIADSHEIWTVSNLSVLGQAYLDLTAPAGTSCRLP